MKNSRNKNLSEHLLNVDEKILSNAYEVDDAEKLKQYVKTKNAKTEKPFYLTPMFRRVATIAACFILVVGVVFSIPALFSPKAPEEQNPHGEVVPPWQWSENAYLSINSIDMLNYFSAVRILADPSAMALTSAKSDAGIMLLSANINASSNSGIMLLSNTGENRDEYGEGYDPSPDRPEVNAPPSSNVIYYELERNAVFTLSKVTFFQIELKDENGFLASKVGTGIVDVVITENDLENMITFRNGDRYYSCCENVGSVSNRGFSRGFSTHKFVENFYLVKNLEQDNYIFLTLQDEEGNVTEIACQPYKNGGPNADTDMSVVSETYTAHVSTSFTIADLEEYFNTGKFPDRSDELNPPETLPETDPPVTAEYYVGEKFVFELISNQTFAYYSTDENEEVYRKGDFYVTANEIILEFKVEGEIVERVTCQLSEQNGSTYFIYMGDEYTASGGGETQ